MIIHKVVLFSNGMVGVFDHRGEQLSEFQGPLHEVRERLRREVEDEVTYHMMSFSSNGHFSVTAEEFFSTGWGKPLSEDHG